MDIECMSQINNVLESNMFIDKLLSLTYKEFQRAFDNNYSLSLAILEQKLRCDEFPSNIIVEKLKECLLEVNTTVAIKENANVIVNDYKALKLHQILKDVKVLPNNINIQIGELQKELEALQDNKTNSFKTLAQIAMDNKDYYFKEKQVKPLHIGFDKLDDMLGGLEGGDMIVVGARPAVGKSALVTQITSNLAKQGKRIGFYNLEMQDKQVYERFLVNESGIGLTRLRRAIRFLGDEKERFDKANEKLARADNIVIASSGSKTVADIRNESRHMDYDIIIIDYLQLLKADNTYRGNRTAEVGEISRAIKNLAMELNIPIIALSQLNRGSEMKENKEPSMSELREAGNIEQDASVIILLWNLSEDDKTRKGCKIEKNRQGECGKIVLKFNGDTMQFEETNEDVKSFKDSKEDGWKKIKESTPFD